MLHSVDKAIKLIHLLAILNQKDSPQLLDVDENGCHPSQCTIKNKHKTSINNGTRINLK